MVGQQSNELGGMRSRVASPQLLVWKRPWTLGYRALYYNDIRPFAGLQGSSQCCVSVGYLE